MNGEAFGYETDWFCRMELQNSLTGIFPKCVHPTFLYESLWNFLGVFLINLYAKHKKYDGQIFLMIFCWYGFGRMFIEGFRTDSLYIPGTTLRISQCLGFACFTVGLALLLFFGLILPRLRAAATTTDSAITVAESDTDEPTIGSTEEATTKETVSNAVENTAEEQNDTKMEEEENGKID